MRGFWRKRLGCTLYGIQIMLNPPLSCTVKWITINFEKRCQASYGNPVKQCTCISIMYKKQIFTFVMLQLFTIIRFYLGINRQKQQRIHFVQYPKCLRVFHETRSVCSLNYPYHNNYVRLRCVIFTRLHYVGYLFIII